MKFLHFFFVKTYNHAQSCLIVNPVILLELIWLVDHGESIQVACNHHIGLLLSRKEDSSTFSSSL